jgi:hypothetical protein
MLNKSSSVSSSDHSISSSAGRRYNGTGVIRSDISPSLGGEGSYLQTALTISPSVMNINPTKYKKKSSLNILRKGDPKRLFD